MGYSNQALVEVVLANALTQGTPSAMPVEIINIGNSPRDSITPELVTDFIRLADQEIEAAITTVYRVPLKRVVTRELEVMQDITAGAFTIEVDDATTLYVGDIVIVSDDTNTEKKIVSILADTTITVSTAFTNSYLAANTKVKVLGFPRPIPLISARKAAANIFDKKFAAGASPAVSEYGKTLRQMAQDDLNDVLNGRARLLGQQMVGRRFYNAALLDTQSTAAKEKNMDNTR